MPTRWSILLLVLLAFALRLLAGLVHPITDRTLYPDAGDYHDLGAALATGGEYGVGGGLAARMPGYPLLIAAVYRVAGPRPGAVLGVQAALGAATCYMVYRLLRRISEPACLVGAALAAVDPLSIVASASLLSETAFTAALVGLVWLAVLTWAQPRRMICWIGLGLCAAAAVYLRASALYLAPVFIAAVLARKQGGWLGAGLALLILIAALLPWKVFLESHPETCGLRGLTSLEGISLYEVVYPGATGGPRQADVRAHAPAILSHMTEAQRNNWWWQAAWQEVRLNPGRILRLAWPKFARTWTPGLNADELRRPALEAVLWLWHVPLFVLAVIGAVRARQFVAVAALLAIGYFALLHLFFMGSVRYRVPLQPLICMLSTLGLWWLGAQRKNARSVC